MTTLILQRTPSGFTPLDHERDKLRHVKVGDIIEVTFKKPRSQQHHKLFFALLSLVHENLPERAVTQFPTVENLLDALKLETGYYETRFMMDGRVYRRPASISFASMDQTAFAEFYDRASKALVGHFFPGTPVEQWQQEAAQMAGCALPEQRG